MKKRLAPLFSAAASNLSMGQSAAAPGQPELEFAFEIRATVAQPRDFGVMDHGRRRVVDITGGTFEGPTIKGRIIPGGADWQSIQEDGLSRLDTRYALETDDGKLIYVQNAALRHAPPEVMARLNAGEIVDPGLVYFRTVPTFETSAPELKWLERSVFIGVGQRFPEDVRVQFWRVK
ncbi:MAG: DUF3237 domain-containing protein [Pseudohongiellaceae bacterium]